MQCVAGAVTAGSAATGLRAWFVLRAGDWLTPRRKTLMTRALILGGLIAASLIGPSAA